MNIPVVWVIGAPCSGKGTQSEKIAGKYGFKHIDPTFLVDIEIDTHTAAGKKFQQMRLTGQEIPLEEMVPLIEKELMGNRGGLKGLVIDGYPTNFDEAEILEHRIGTPDLIVALDVQEDITSRRTSRAGSVGRASVAEHRASTQPILTNYALITLQVNGEEEPDQVFEVISEHMDNLVKNRKQIKIGR
ncbi:adenylate kinase isoenzyme 1 isoform X2 [Drosophila bipectinata]|uniref:adenylate kinase isoenzyme 1 isoform X2 n=1 Tax=Drosophila bipectinata TaxID=42026 RepID=UPI0038B34A50